MTPKRIAWRSWVSYRKGYRDEMRTYSPFVVWSAGVSWGLAAAYVLYLVVR